MSNLIQKLKEGSEQRSVLIVDDDHELANSLGRILKMFFEHCVITHDGEEALKLYKESLEKSEPFTLVVTDLELPKKGGLTLIKEIRELAKEQAILIISAHDASEFITEAISLDVKGYILKPVAMPKLFEHLEKILFEQNTSLEKRETVDSVTHWGTKEKLEELLTHKLNTHTLLLRIKVNYLSNIYHLIGNEYADQYLKELALLLENIQLDSDALFYRLSLDELVIVLKNNSLNYAKKLAQEMVSIARYFHISENGIIINSTLSIGIAQGEKNLLQNAKQALEKSSESGNGFVASYTQEEYDKDLSITHGRDIMKMIYKAIEDDAVIPYIQPVVDIKTQEVELFSSYVRIMQEEKVYSPETFLNIAQNAHQMSMITRSMIKSTFALSTKSEHNEALFTIYLANEDFYDESLLPYILFWSSKYGVEPSRIAFEISQTDFTDNETSKGFSLLHELKRNGFQFVLNNFGLNSYNLMAILEFQPQYIKLDPKLLKKGMLRNRHQNIEKIIEVIHLIGAKAIATHISDKELLDFMETTSIDYIQGYQVCAPYKVETYE
ncbi:EAL domain-containing response regulator [Sulfurimonas marina]|nr:EAL domain-containing protein [Sulfurimonas marina]